MDWYFYLLSQLMAVWLICYQHTEIIEGILEGEYKLGKTEREPEGQQWRAQTFSFHILLGIWHSTWKTFGSCSISALEILTHSLKLLLGSSNLGATLNQNTTPRSGAWPWEEPVFVFLRLSKFCNVAFFQTQSCTKAIRNISQGFYIPFG